MNAIYHGVALLRAGMVERVLVGGAEAPLTEFTLQQLRAMRIYAAVPGAGEAACRPFATPASGMAVGEGAAFLALSLAEGGTGLSLGGIAATREVAQSLTGITTEGRGLQVAMREVIAAGGRPDFVVAHAPGTARGDAAERRALAAVFGAEQPEIRSYKPYTGHTFGASGPLGAVAALEALRTGGVVGSALVNATGFGGNVTSLLLTRGGG